MARPTPARSATASSAAKHLLGNSIVVAFGLTQLALPIAWLLSPALLDLLDYDPVSIWSLGASILAPLFQGGRLTAQFDQANAQRDQAAFAYRDTALRVFAEVENALTSERRLREQIDRAIARRAILQRSLIFARDRFRGGYASHLDELDAQRNLFTVELNAIGVCEQQLNAMIRLWAALCGGWDMTGLPAQRR